MLPRLSGCASRGVIAMRNLASVCRASPIARSGRSPNCPRFSICETREMERGDRNESNSNACRDTRGFGKAHSAREGRGHASRDRGIARLGDYGAGDPLPGFALPNSYGQEVRSADLLAKGPLVLTFYRGAW